MTFEEQVAILSVKDFWSVPALPRLGTGKLRVTDGPNGARGAGSLGGGVTASAFPAILQAWHPGQEAGNAIADVLFGDAEPGGRLPQTFPRRREDNPTRSEDLRIYPGSAGSVRYAEGVFVGFSARELTCDAPLMLDAMRVP